MTTTELEHEPLSRFIVRRVKGLLREQDMTQEDLGRILGLSRGAISDRMRGRTKFDVDELEDLAAAVGESLSYVMGWTNERRSDPFRSMMDRAANAGRQIPNTGGLLDGFRDDRGPRRSPDEGLSELVRHQGLEPRTRCLGLVA